MLILSCNKIKNVMHASVLLLKNLFRVLTCAIGSIQAQWKDQVLKPSSLALVLNV